MVRGIGIDIVDNRRFSSSTEGFLKSIFTPLEMEEASRRVDREEFYASRFALKEAFVKALGTGFRGFGPRDIEVFEDGKGRPCLRFSEKIVLEKELEVFASLSHEREYSVAMVVLDGSK